MNEDVYRPRFSEEQTVEQQAIFAQPIETVMKSRRVCRPFRGHLSAIDEGICQQVRQNLMGQLQQQFDRSPNSVLTQAELQAMRDEAFRQTLNDANLTALALEAQKHPTGSGLRRHALDNLIAALWLVHFSRKVNRSLLEEEAISETLKHICENIDQFQPARNDRPVQVMAWVEYWRKLFLAKAQKEHETQPNRFVQPNKVWKRMIGIKYELTCLVTKSKLEDLITWIHLEVKSLVPSRYPGMVIVFLLAVILSLAQLRAMDQRAADTILFAMAEQVLEPVRFQAVSTGQDGESEAASLLENLPQPDSPQFMAEQLREYIRSDPDGILQKSVRDRPDATFQAIALKYLDGQSWQTIAETFGAQKSNLSTFSTFYARQLEKLAPQIRAHLQAQFD